MNPFIVCLILLAIILCLMPRGLNQPKRKAKKFGEGMFVDTHAKDESLSVGVDDWRP